MKICVKLPELGPGYSTRQGRKACLEPATRRKSACTRTDKAWENISSTSEAVETHGREREREVERDAEDFRRDNLTGHIERRGSLLIVRQGCG